MPVDPDSAPAPLRVSHTTDRLTIQLPMPVTSARRIPVAATLLASGVLAVMISAAFEAWTVALVLGGSLLSAALLTSVASRIQPTLFWPHVVRMPTIELTRDSLHVTDERGHKAIPLASIRRVGISGDTLVVDWTEGRFDVSDALRPNEYHWMQALIADHAETARIAELELGVDLDRPAVVPEAVSELLGRDR